MHKLMREKLELIDSTADMQIESIVDFGGMWGVEGGYLDYAAGKHEARGIEVDFHAAVPGFECYRGDFTGWLKNRSNLDGWARFDMALLFDVLLHQQCPMEVLRNLTTRCRKAILISQPCTRDEVPSSVNLQSMDEGQWRDLYEMGGRDVYAEANGRPRRWDTGAWGWGQSVPWLQGAMASFGWVSVVPAFDWVPDSERMWGRVSMLFVPGEEAGGKTDAE